MRFGPDCPRCGNPVSFWAVQWGRGRAFPCGDCGQRLAAPKVGTFAIIAILAGLFAFRDRLADNPYGWLVILLTIILLGIFEYLLLRVRVVEDRTP